MRTGRRILVASNGHGEDDIACKVIDEVLGQYPDEFEIEAWPMVGEGHAYRQRNLPVVGPLNTLPSAGFATLDRNLMIEDLKSGWIGTHWRQFRFARSIQQRYQAIVGVGDIIPLLVSRFSRTPLYFVACAKSAYYESGDGYTRLEKRLMRRWCARIFPRDRLTSTRLAAAGVRNTYLGNPMMDGLTKTGRLEKPPSVETGIALLPGSRNDAPKNLLLLLDSAVRLSERSEGASSYRFAVAAHGVLEPGTIRQVLSETDGGHRWSVTDDDEGNGIDLRDSAGNCINIRWNCFADILHTSELVIGMAGTANEQAIGLGIPLVTVPSSGVQGLNYVRMKMKFFGDAAIMAAPDPDAIANSALLVLKDEKVRRKMAEAGRERMGEPGASKAIAAAIHDHIAERPEDDFAIQSGASQ